MSFSTGGDFSKPQTLDMMLKDMADDESGDLRVEEAFSVFTNQLEA